MEAQFATVEYEGRTTKFVVSNPKDYIQNIHKSGNFYELDQLSCQRALIYRGCIVIDVGANVGNHTLFYAGHTAAARVFPFEPNPTARALLEQNVQLNSATTRVDMRYVSLAAGSKSASYDIAFSRENNLGATALKAAAERTGEARIEGARLDDLDFGDRVGFVKIDVEGMEMEVLDGAAEMFSHQRPHLAIEVDMRNERPFWGWLDHMNYHVIAVHHAYQHNRNYIAIPRL
jgi:FkbM family methyltransferase